MEKEAEGESKVTEVKAAGGRGLEKRMPRSKEEAKV